MKTAFRIRFAPPLVMLTAATLLSSAGCNQEPSAPGHAITADGRAIEVDEHGYPLDGRPPDPTYQEPLGLEVEHFTLTDQDGNPFDSAQFDGEVWVANFFFTTCPGPCMKLSQTIDRLHRDLGPSGVHFVSITVDPANDTPEQLTKYARQFGAQAKYWNFLTGAKVDLDHVASYVFRVPVQDLLHSEKLILVNPQGEIVGYYHGTDDTKVAQLKRKALQLLAEREGAEEKPVTDEAATKNATPNEAPEAGTPS